MNFDDLPRMVPLADGSGAILKSNEHESWWDALGKPVTQANLCRTANFLVEQGVPPALAELCLPIVARDIQHDNPLQAQKGMRFLVNETLGYHGTETIVLMALAYLTAPQIEAVYVNGEQRQEFTPFQPTETQPKPRTATTTAILAFQRPSSVPVRSITRRSPRRTDQT